MRPTAVIAFVVLVGAATTSASEVAAQKPSLESLGWMGGCWERARGDLVIEEHWLPPRGGLMLGVNRTLRAGRAVAHEFLRIAEGSGGIVLVAAPSGQSATDFGAVVVSDTLAIFENPAHDFPRRIVYAAGPDSLGARIEGETDGVRRRVDFSMARVPCDPPGDGPDGHAEESHEGRGSPRERTP